VLCSVFEIYITCFVVYVTTVPVLKLYFIMASVLYKLIRIHTMTAVIPCKLKVQNILHKHLFMLHACILNLQTPYR
jgi:hypothetical protein